MTHRTLTLALIVAALALVGAFVGGRLSAPDGPAPSPQALAPSPSTSKPAAQRDVSLASDRRALAAEVEPAGPSVAGVALGTAAQATGSGAAETETLGPLARRYPLLVELIEFDGVPFAQLDLDDLRGLQFMRLLRSVRTVAAVEETAAIAAIPEPLRRTVSRTSAEEALAGGPEAYFAKLPATKGSGFGTSTYVELTEDLTPVLHQLRELSIEVHTHPVYEDYKLGWAGIDNETREPLPIVEWKAEKWGARLVGYDASGTALATSESKWLGMP